MNTLFDNPLFFVFVFFLMCLVLNCVIIVFDSASDISLQKRMEFGMIAILLHKQNIHCWKSIMKMVNQQELTNIVLFAAVKVQLLRYIHCFIFYMYTKAIVLTWILIHNMCLQYLCGFSQFYLFFGDFVF